MTSPSEKHMEAAANALMRAITASRVKNADAGIQIIAAALANAEREGMRRAAEIVRTHIPYMPPDGPSGTDHLLVYEALGSAMTDIIIKAGDQP